MEKKVGSKFLTELNGITLYQNEDEVIMKCLGDCLTCVLSKFYWVPLDHAKYQLSNAA